MVNERVICCCGASSWTRVIAWFQIVGNSLLLILTIAGIAAAARIDKNDENIQNKSALMAALAFAFIISFFGIVMGVILLKGTNQKRVSYIKAWLIYGIAAFAVSIIGIILNAGGGYSHSSTVGTAVVSGILGIAINLFSLIVVYIHMKEINEGVFIP